MPHSVKPQRSSGALSPEGDLASQGLVRHWDTFYCARSETKEVVLWSATASEQLQHSLPFFLHFLFAFLIDPMGRP